MIKFNINDHILIKITEAGWKHLRATLDEDYIKHCIISRRVIIDDNEVWFRLQAHSVFELLPLNSATDLLYETNILIDDEVKN
jgi:hypothetical protein